jgi:hypothetical protein
VGGDVGPELWSPLTPPPSEKAGKKVDWNEVRLGAAAHRLLKQLYHSGEPLEYFGHPKHIEIVAAFLGAFEATSLAGPCESARGSRIR